jgi:hypothetical protein
MLKALKRHWPQRGLKNLLVALVGESQLSAICFSPLDGGHGCAFRLCLANFSGVG